RNRGSTKRRCSMAKPMWILAVNTPKPGNGAGRALPARSTGATSPGVAAVVRGAILRVGGLVQLIGRRTLATGLAAAACLAGGGLGAAVTLRLVARLALAEASSLAVAARMEAFVAALLRQCGRGIVAAVAGRIGVGTVAAIGGLAFVVGFQGPGHGCIPSWGLRARLRRRP